MALLCSCVSAWGDDSEGALLAHWSFDADRKAGAMDEVTGKGDPVFGNVGHVVGVSGKAAKFDGFRSYIRRDFNTVNPSGAFTAEAWVALGSYPWSWAPVIDCTSDIKRGFSCAIGPEGQVKFKIAAGSLWHEVTSQQRIPLRQWTHVAVVHDPKQGIAIHINGKQVAKGEVQGSFIPATGRRRGSLTMGRTNVSQSWHEYQLTTEGSHFFLDGLLDEIKVTAKAKSSAELMAGVDAVGKLMPPALSDRSTLPIGPRAGGEFGAFYTKLDYYKEWDDMWRVGNQPDIFVRFDDSPVQLVFWRGASFVPCWVNEKRIWYTNEWLETWGSDVASCAEPIMDRHCRFSHVRLIEQTDARVVVHWRYALNDAFYKIAAISDDGRGEWCDEYHIIYPDQIGVRRIELHYSKPERKHDWVEQIVVLPPGKHPDDAVEKSAITLINMDGESRDYSWHDKDFSKDMPEPKGANISLVNMKSKYRPFIVVPPDPVETIEGKWDSPFFRSYASKMATSMRPDPAPSVYGWWDHWPVAQVPGDGRWVTEPDRPSHFTLTTFVQWKDHAYSDRTRTRIMLQGMTDQSSDELVKVAHSWLRGPKMLLKGSAFRDGSYDTAERAYVAQRASGGDFECHLEASKKSLLLNPAFIVRQWGQRKARLFVDGKEIDEGKDFKQGIRKGVHGDDLIVWIRMERDTPVRIELK